MILAHRRGLNFISPELVQTRCVGLKPGRSVCTRYSPRHLEMLLHRRPIVEHTQMKYCSAHCHLPAEPGHSGPRGNAQWWGDEGSSAPGLKLEHYEHVSTGCICHGSRCRPRHVKVFMINTIICALDQSP